MTLKELKDQYAESIGLDNWEEVIEFSDELDYHIDEILFLAQQKALENAHEVFLNNDVGDTLEKELILNETNILK